MTMNLRTSLLFFLLLLLAGCASAPLRELQNARKAVARAYAEEAPRYASREYQGARTALEDGESLVRRGDYQLAAKALVYAETHGRQAASEARQEKTRIEQERLRYYQELVHLEQPPPPPEAEKKPKKEKVATPAPSPPSPPAKPEPVPKKPPVSRYTVANGETLWTIAARRDIYVDALLWPLIYKANRDQIKDPRQIYPGQVLNIPRDVSAAEKEEARETARHSDIFPLELLIGNSSKNAR